MLRREGISSLCQYNIKEAGNRSDAAKSKGSAYEGYDSGDKPICAKKQEDSEANKELILRNLMHFIPDGNLDKPSLSKELPPPPCPDTLAIQKPLSSEGEQAKNPHKEGNNSIKEEILKKYQEAMKNSGKARKDLERGDITMEAYLKVDQEAMKAADEWIKFDADSGGAAKRRKPRPLPFQSPLRPERSKLPPIA